MASTCAPVDFVWPHVAKSVRVTGEFCGWNEGVPMTKRDDGVFGERRNMSASLVASRPPARPGGFGVPGPGPR